MPRIPHAGQQLVDQVTAERKSAKAKWSEVDGLDVYRNVEFDKATSAWLEPLLAEMDDERIVGYGSDKNGVLTVVFSHRSVADFADEFPLADAAEVVGDQG